MGLHACPIGLYMCWDHYLLHTNPDDLVRLHRHLGTIYDNPIYCVAFVIVLARCFSSDIQKERPKHIMAMAGMSTISLVIVAASSNSKVRYTFLAFGTSGIWCCSSLTLIYLSNTMSRPAEKRAVSMESSTRFRTFLPCELSFLKIFYERFGRWGCFHAG